MSSSHGDLFAPLCSWQNNVYYSMMCSYAHVPMCVHGRSPFFLKTENRWKYVDAVRERRDESRPHAILEELAGWRQKAVHD